jgi:ParB/RepB/Spo0J family partition protein
MESPTNPRQHFDPADMEEIIGSVKKRGVIYPILIRPIPPQKGKVFEIVSGHRRARAAKKAGLKEIPANIRELNDKEVLEIQLIELMQSKDPHELDQAVAFAGAVCVVSEWQAGIVISGMVSICSLGLLFGTYIHYSRTMSRSYRKMRP